MHLARRLSALALVVVTGMSVAACAVADSKDGSSTNIAKVGSRPLYLVRGMDDSPLKGKLLQCAKGPFFRTDFTIGHRGAALQYPAHTQESYQAGADQGAGIVECDVTFTKDGALVCRHDECDLHTTTNIVDTPLNNACTTPWSGQGSTPKCCASDLTLAQFKSLRGKMDASNPTATTAAGYLGGTASWRTDVNTGRGTLMTLRESIELNQRNGVKHTPELKTGNVARVNQVFGSYDKLRQKLIDELRAGGVKPQDAWPQSFNLADMLYWVEKAPEFGRQAVSLDDVDPSAGFYYAFDPQGRAVKKDSDMYKALDVLAKDVKILGIFSDWPETVTYYANCMGLK